MNLLRSAVVFIDLLGVRKSIAADVPEEKQLAEAIALRAALDSALPELLEDVEEDMDPTLAATAFTDNVVVGIPLRGEYADEGDLGSAFINVGRFQLAMVLAGYPLRGAIAVGPLYVDGDMAWGSGLLAAVEAEHDLARDPRVVLTKEAMKLMLQHLRYYAKISESPHTREILVDWDAQPFVNYLDASDAEDGLGPDPDIIVKHRDVVVHGLKEHRFEPRVRPKYLWMANYHNHFCSEHNFQGLSVPDAEINRTYLRLHEVFPKDRLPPPRKRERSKKPRGD